MVAYKSVTYTLKGYTKKIQWKTWIAMKIGHFSLT